MAAINAVGYKADNGSTMNHPLREAIQKELAKRNVPSLAALKDFFDKHRKRTDNAELGQYISFALSCSGPPSFEFTQRDVDIPPDAAALRDLSHLMAAFYKEANVDDLWKRSQPAIDQYLARYQEPVINTVQEINGYLRQMTGAVSGVRSELRDAEERVWGDVGVVTCWLEQDYTFEGDAQHISAPTTIVLRREGGEWKVVLFHSIPLPE